jgi:hypothetical protein
MCAKFYQMLSFSMLFNFHKTKQQGAQCGYPAVWEKKDPFSTNNSLSALLL